MTATTQQREAARPNYDGDPLRELAFDDTTHHLPRPLAGALTSGLTSQLEAVLPEGLGTAGQIGARVTLQGGIQALMGGRFRDGALTALAAELANLTASEMNKVIADAVRDGTMSATDAVAARAFARMFTSAVRAMGNPDDPMHAFASSFVSDTLAAAGGTGAPQPGAGDSASAVTGPAFAFDDDGNLMPGVTSASAPWDQQLRDVHARLIAQGMDPASAGQTVAAYDERAQANAFATFMDRQPEPTLVAGIGATPEIRSARDVMDDIGSGMAAGTLRGERIGQAIGEAYDAYLRLGAAAEAAPGQPSREQERVAAQLITMIGDLGRLAEQNGTTLSPEQLALVRDAQVATWHRFWSTAEEAATAAVGPLAARRAAAQAWQARERLYVDPNGTWTRRPSGVSDAALQLERSLAASGQPRPAGNYSPHHIVGFGQNDAPTQQLLTRFGISPNEAVNGVWLSRSMHVETFTESYRIWVGNELSRATSASHARTILADIKSVLQRGATPWKL